MIDPRSTSDLHGQSDLSSPRWTLVLARDHRKNIYIYTNSTSYKAVGQYAQHFLYNLKKGNFIYFCKKKKGSPSPSMAFSGVCVLINLFWFWFCLDQF